MLVLHLLEPWALENPQDRASLPAFALCLHECGLLEHVTCLKKMQFSKSDPAFSLWLRRIFLGDKQWLWLAFAKAKASTSFGWKVPVPLCFCQSRMRLWGQLWAVDSKMFSGMWEKGGLTRIDKQNQPWPTPSGMGGAGGPKPKGEDAYPRDDCMKKIWRNCYIFGTKSFSGDWKTIAGFRDADRC